MEYINLLNCTVLIRRQNAYSFEKHNILINDLGTIEAFDCKTKYAYSINMYPCIVFPHFFNIHCHLGESIFKNISGYKWNLEKYLKFTDDFNHDILPSQIINFWEQSAVYTLNELLRNGTFGICAARSSEICKKHKYYNMSGYPIMNSNKLIDYKQKGINGFKEYKKMYQNNLCSVGIFFHSLYSNDKTSLELAKECMDNGAEFFSTHISEDLNTRNMEIKRFEKEPIVLLDQYGLLSDKTILVHCGYVSDYELKLIAKKNASIVVCPISNTFLNSKIPNIKRIDELNINWCLATDGVATGKTLSLLEQANELKKQFSNLSFENLFEHFTETPAKLYNRGFYSGRIQPGCKARFLVTKDYVCNVHDFFKKLFSGKLKWKMWSFS